MKKVLSLVLAVVLAFSTAVTAFAQSFTPAVDKTAVKAGEDITVTLSFEEALVDVTSFEARLYYNNNLFDYKSNTLNNANGFVTAAPQSDAEGTYMEITHFEMSGFGTVAAGEYGKITFTAKSDISQKQVAEFTARIETGLMKDQSIISTENVKIETTVSPASCDHVGTETETAYTAKGDGKHTVTVTCKKCGEVISTGEEVCAGDEEHTTYVSKNDGNHTKTVKCAKCDYVISTADETCTKGEDGKCAHCGYVFPTVGEDEYTITVNVAPSTVNVTFYGDENGENALAADKVVDKGVVGKYHVYEVTVPEGMYSYRAVDTADNHELGGMTFEAPVSVEIGADGKPIHSEQKMTLVRVNYYTENPKVQKVGDYSINIMPGKMKSVVTGAQYIYNDGFDDFVITPTLLFAHGNALLYNWQVTLNEELSKTYGVALSINKTFSEGASRTIEETFFLKSLVSYTVTAPKGATVRFFNQIKNFNVEELSVASTTENEDGTVTSVLRAPGGNLMYRVSMEGKVTKAGYLDTSKNKDITVTFGENEDPESTVNNVDSAILAKRMESSTLVNVNGQNNLSLGIGETFRLRAYRGAWQIVNSDTANIMIEPDFNYAVLSGGSHIKMTPAANRCTGNAGEGEKTNWMDIEGVSEGVAIIEVSYDAIEIGGSTQYTGIYGATDPKRTSLVVINVGGAKGELSMRAVGTENPWDTEYDTVYTLTNAAVFSFNATLDGEKPTVQFSTDKGKTWKNVGENADGSFTALGLVEGNNILKFTANGKTAYQVVRAAKITYTVTNETRGGDVAYIGDNISVVFHGLYQPVPKFSGIYNPGFGQGHKVTYTTSDNAEFVKASGGQYDFISTNKYTFKVIADGDIKLTGGNVHFNVMGTESPLGGHRILTDNGVGANFSAVSTIHVRDVMPDITISSKNVPTITVKFVCSPASAVVTLMNASGTAVEASADGSFAAQPGKYTYTVTANGYISEHGSITLTEADVSGKTVTVDLAKGNASMWDGKTLTEITPNADGVYEVRTGAELAWVASEVNKGNAVSRVKLMNDISLGNNEWTPIGNNYKEFVGEFDGNGHVVSDLYINNKSGRQALFGTVRSATITDLGVKGSVTSNQQYAAGLVAYAYENTVISRCFSAVDVTTSSKVAGILANPQFETITITDCYNVGNITATAANGIASGISNSCSQQGKSPKITNCYNVGRIIGATRSGAISDTTKADAIVNCYYLKDCTSNGKTTGFGTEKTESEMKAAEMVALLGASFHADSANINNGYPILTRQYWGETTYTWSEDNGSVTAVHAALNNPNEVEEETVNTVYSVVKAATCEEKGEGKFVATFTKFAAAEKTVEIPAIGHKWGKPTYEWSADHSTLTGKVVCENDNSHVHTEKVNSTAVTENATCTEKGKITYTAEFGENEYGFTTQTAVVENAVLGHDWGETEYTWNSDNSEATAKHTCKRDPSHTETETVNTVYSVVKAATCDVKGEGKFVATFTKFAAAEKTVEIPAIGHKWGKPTYEWSADHSTLTGKVVCENDSNHVHTEKARVTSKTLKEATCTEKGKVEFTAEFGANIYGFEKQIKTVDTPALEHDWGETEYTWNSDNSEATAKHTCKRDPSHTETETVEPVYSVVKAATCIENGEGKFVATFTKFAAAEKTVEIPAIGHKWGKPTYEWSANNSTLTGKVVCENDNNHVHTEDARVTSKTLKEATCTEKGQVEFTAEFGANIYGFEKQIKVVDTPALGHKLVHHAAKAATCIAEGNIEYWECTVCKKLYSDKDAKNEVTTIVTPKDPKNHVGETELKNAKAATCTESGYTGDTYCKSCGELIEKGKASPVVPHQFGEWIIVKQPTRTEAGEKVRYCKVCNLEQRMEIPRLSDNSQTIHIVIGGDKNKGENNPETGAPAPNGFAAVAVLAAAAVILGKKKRG